MNSAARLPEWLKVRLPGGPAYERLKRASRQRGLATVCEQARCPNLAECWGGGTATFMVMGPSCTRGCRFCSVASQAQPPPPAEDEPALLAQTLAEMRLEYAVLTTVCRDDLPDQGAGHLARCIAAVKAECPRMRLEMLAQDFRGEKALLERIMDAGPDVLAHNVECVERLTPVVRDSRAGYRQSLEVLEHAKRYRPALPTKSSIMLGLGETQAELRGALLDLRAVGCDIVTMGQYLRPSGRGRNLPVARFLPPEEFERLGSMARGLGFAFVASGPFVRSSYRAAELFLSGRLEAHAS
ncbi:MAG: lipoyl synthase [Elusimicrobia bacterium]|nr:lipoyl synthase [Elusimicrobiota bacterium]MDE2237083.1 lipoyl synthase [Elusimicrobiota bacterium]MDE2426880.1 lipoyl synthase [Elusimicrobiota bacterium]